MCFSPIPLSVQATCRARPVGLLRKAPEKADPLAAPYAPPPFWWTTSRVMAIRTGAGLSGSGFPPISMAYPLEGIVMENAVFVIVLVSLFAVRMYVGVHATRVFDGLPAETKRRLLRYSGAF